MKKYILNYSILFAFLAILSGCKKENGDNNNGLEYATLTMNVNGVPFTSNKANALFSSSANTFIFSNTQESNKHAISVVSYLGYTINADYSINKNTIDAGSISQAMFLRNGNAFDQFSFPIISEKGYLNYRVVKKHTATSGDRFDVNFNGVVYASETDSVIITNGTIRY